MAKISVTVTLTVSAGSDLTVQSPEDLGPVGGPLANPGLIISGGQPPYTVSNISGNLPPGVTINGDGTFSGVPTQEGSFDVTLDVADAQG